MTNDPTPYAAIESASNPAFSLDGVHINESEQIVGALRACRKPVQYEVFDYAGHGFLRSDHKARTDRAVAAFLAAHLAPSTAPSPAA